MLFRAHVVAEIVRISVPETTPCRLVLKRACAFQHSDTCKTLREVKISAMLFAA